MKFASYENAIFNWRGIIIALSLLLTIFMGSRAVLVRPDTRLERLIPASHEFVQNAHGFLDESAAGGSYIRVAVARQNGTIFDYDYLLTLQKISDELSLLDGVDTGSLNSLWSPGMLWFAISAEGYDSGPVIDFESFTDSSEGMEQIRTNVLRAGILGTYVSNDFKASMINIQAMPLDLKTRQPLDTRKLAAELERVRQKYQTDEIRVHIIGDLKKISDLVDGFGKIALFFLGALVITAILLFQYSRCYKSTILALVCSLVAVVWQLGILNLLGFNLGVFSVLVPFLVFAIAVSHGVQVINAVSHEMAKGEDPLSAARITFHHLHKPGLLALLSDGIGFAMLFIIDIGAIKDLAMVASVGVALVIFTNLVLLPVLLSYFGVTQGCIDNCQCKMEAKSVLWDTIGSFAYPPANRWALLAAAVLLVGALVAGTGLKIGDLDRGAPELRADSRYNLDNNYITTNFSTSTDLMTVFVGTAAGKCEMYKTVDLIDRLGWRLINTEGVQNVSSPATRAKMNRYLNNEGSLKLMSIPRDQKSLSRSMAFTGYSATEIQSGECDRQQIELELTDHRQETLQRVVSVVRQFAQANDDADIWFLLGDGNAAYEAATNEVISRAQYEILGYVYGVVALMCLIMFRSWRAVVCILTPLALTSIMCQGLMALLGIGIKVATLPVIALGVGIGVDYGIYIFSRFVSYLKMGHDIGTAYTETQKMTGKAVFFTGVTLAVGVATWMFSPIKFQADMGILLTFMFLWNMVGALVLLPALSSFLIKPENYKTAGDADGTNVKSTDRNYAVGIERVKKG